MTTRNFVQSSSGGKWHRPDPEDRGRPACKTRLGPNGQWVVHAIPASDWKQGWEPVCHLCRYWTDGVWWADYFEPTRVVTWRWDNLQ